eukprot:1182952-Heterocapsa_arctica.AAC.1
MFTTTTTTATTVIIIIMYRLPVPGVPLPVPRSLKARAAPRVSTVAAVWRTRTRTSLEYP